MNVRRFAPRCGECRQKTMAIASVPYSIQIQHDGKKFDVEIPALSVPKCQNPACGSISIDDLASEQIDRAFRKVAQLLTPEEILEGRIRVGYANQQKFAACFGVSPSTVSRWENGSQIQQSFHDGMLRAFFELVTFRRFLENLHGIAPMTQPESSAGRTSRPQKQIPDSMGQQIRNQGNSECEKSVSCFSAKTEEKRGLKSSFHLNYALAS